ncbi:MAG: cohesin domain-containing protein [Oscillospiraceae bacterium]
MKEILHKYRAKFIAAAVIVAVFAVAVIVLLSLKPQLLSGKPKLILSSPPPLAVSDRNEFTIDVTVSKLPDNLYCAASVAIVFDKNKLEFTGVKQGTMMTYGDKQANGSELTIPTWQGNTETANQTGQINAMYLDMTAGKYAYCAEGFDSENNNVMLRLGFKLRDSVYSGEVLDLTVADAVLATVTGDSDGSSLATVNKTLQPVNAKIVVK